MFFCTIATNISQQLKTGFLLHINTKSIKSPPLPPHVKKPAWIQWHPDVIVLQMYADQVFAVSLPLSLSLILSLSVFCQGQACSLTPLQIFPSSTCSRGSYYRNWHNMIKKSYFLMTRLKH